MHRLYGCDGRECDALAHRVRDCSVQIPRESHAPSPLATSSHFWHPTVGVQGKLLIQSECECKDACAARDDCNTINFRPNFCQLLHCPHCDRTDCQYTSALDFAVYTQLRQPEVWTSLPGKGAISTCPKLATLTDIYAVAEEGSCLASCAAPSPCNTVNYVQRDRCEHLKCELCTSGDCALAPSAPGSVVFVSTILGQSTSVMIPSGAHLHWSASKHTGCLAVDRIGGVTLAPEQGSIEPSRLVQGRHAWRVGSTRLSLGGESGVDLGAEFTIALWVRFPAAAWTSLNASSVVGAQGARLAILSSVAGVFAVAVRPALGGSQTLALGANAETDAPETIRVAGELRAGRWALLLASARCGVNGSVSFYYASADSGGLSEQGSVPSDALLGCHQVRLKALGGPSTEREWWLAEAMAWRRALNSSELDAMYTLTREEGGLPAESSSIASEPTSPPPLPPPSPSPQPPPPDPGFQVEQYMFAFGVVLVVCLLGCIFSWKRRSWKRRRARGDRPQGVELPPAYSRQSFGNGIIEGSLAQQYRSPGRSPGWPSHRRWEGAFDPQQGNGGYHNQADFPFPSEYPFPADYPYPADSNESSAPVWPEQVPSEDLQADVLADLGAWPDLGVYDTTPSGAAGAVGRAKARQQSRLAPAPVLGLAHAARARNESPRMSARMSSSNFPPRRRDAPSTQAQTWDPGESTPRLSETPRLAPPRRLAEKGKGNAWVSSQHRVRRG